MHKELFLPPVDSAQIDILLKKIKESNHDAFNRLFMEYYPQVKAFLFGFIKNMDDASDMAQDIFVKIWQNRDALPQIANFKSYLFRTAKNAVLNFIEHTLVEKNFQDKAVVKSLSKPYYQEVIEDDLYARELEMLLDMAVEQMPEQRKKIFKLSRKEGLSNEEISHMLQINKRTVENHITNALKDLRKIVSSTLSILS